MLLCDEQAVYFKTRRTAKDEGQIYGERRVHSFSHSSTFGLFYAMRVNRTKCKIHRPLSPFNHDEIGDKKCKRPGTAGSMGVGALLLAVFLQTHVQNGRFIQG